MKKRLEFPLHSLRLDGLLGLFCVALYAAPVAAQEMEPFQWSITPYLWASETKVDLTLRDGLSGGDTISFDDLLDTLDTAIMVHFESGRGHWSGFADLTYLETSDTQQRTLFTVDTDSEQTVLDAAAAWWPAGVGSAFNLYGGVRYSSFDSRYRFRIDDRPAFDRRSSSDYYDALFGLRYRFELSQRWALLTRADFSFGDSEGTYLVQANLAWTVGKRGMNRLLLGYQYKKADFRDGDLRTNYRNYGPLAGFNFRF